MFSHRTYFFMRKVIKKRTKNIWLDARRLWMISDKSRVLVLKIPKFAVPANTTFIFPCRQIERDNRSSHEWSRGARSDTAPSVLTDVFCIFIPSYPSSTHIQHSETSFTHTVSFSLRGVVKSIEGHKRYIHKPFDHDRTDWRLCYCECDETNPSGSW